MIRMAFETPRLGMIWARRVASLARRNARNENVARFRARKRFLMTAYTSEPGVGGVIEF